MLGVLAALIVTDLTMGTGRFNLAQGFVGMVSGVGASLSTTLSGLVAREPWPRGGISGHRRSRPRRFPTRVVADA